MFDCVWMVLPYVVILMFKPYPKDVLFVFVCVFLAKPGQKWWLRGKLGEILFGQWSVDLGRLFVKPYCHEMMNNFEG